MSGGPSRVVPSMSGNNSIRRWFHVAMNKPIRPLALPDSAPCSGLEVVTLAADGSTAPLRMLQRFAIDAHAALCDHARGVSDESTLLRIQSAWINTVGIESTDQLAEVLKNHPGALDPDAGDDTGPS